MTQKMMNRGRRIDIYLTDELIRYLNWTKNRSGRIREIVEKDYNDLILTVLVAFKDAVKSGKELYIVREDEEYLYTDVIPESPVLTVDKNFVDGSDPDKIQDLIEEKLDSMMI